MPGFLLLPGLEFSTAELRIYLRGARRHEHTLHATHIGIDVGVKAGSNEGPRCVGAAKEGVRTAWAVEVGAFGDVVDCAVDGQVDGFGGIGAVVVAELGVCEGDWSGLG